MKAWPAAVLSGVALAASIGRAEQPGGTGIEPTYRIACQWWTELPKKWTPVGWRNHLFRYNVLFNGAVVAEPQMNRRTSKWSDQGMLLWPSLAEPADEGTIRQGWRTDHEAPVLWTDWGRSAFGDAQAAGVSLRQSEHALLTGDEKFIEEYVPAIVKSCEWIRDARKNTGHGGVEGILPGAVATDEGKQVQAIWNDGWNYKGLITAVRLLKRIKHARASEFEAEARDYRQRFRAAYVEAARHTPTWLDAAGKLHSRPPRNLSGDKSWGLDHAFYLDCGPLFLVFAGLMDAEEDLMRTARLWFREGPPRKTYKDNGQCWQPASLRHEISSCEPCYSWVYFHSWQMGDRPRFLEAMYSLYTGAASRQTHTVCETRGGITGVTPCLPGAWLVRLAVVDDQIRDNELHLLRLCPLAWLTTDKEASFERLPTEFGPLTLKVKLADGGKTLRVAFSPRFRITPQRVMLHVPPLEGLSSVVFNDKSLSWDGKTTALKVQ